MKTRIEQEKDDGSIESVDLHEVIREFENASCRVHVRQQHEGSDLYDVFCVYAECGSPKRIMLATCVGLAAGWALSKRWLPTVDGVNDYGKPIMEMARRGGIWQ